MIDRRQVLIAAAAAGLGTHLSVGAQERQYKKEYRLSLVSPPGTLWYKTAELFAAAVLERTSGRIAIKLYPGSSLVQGQQDRELAALRQGGIDIIVGTGVNYAGTVKELGLFSLPFLMTNSREIDAVLASSALNDDFYSIIRRAGAEPLASAEYGYVQLFNSRRRLDKPADVAGMKIRVVSTPLFQDVLASVGANPTSMSWAEAQAALASSAVDGVMLTSEQAAGVKVYTLGQKYFLKWNAFSELLHICVANPVWATWSAEDQQAVRGAARDVAKDITRLVRSNEQAAEELLRRAGVDVFSPSPAALDEWRTLMRRQYAKWKATIGPELVTKFETVIAKAPKGA